MTLFVRLVQRIVL